MKSYRIYMNLMDAGVNFRLGGQREQETEIDRYFGRQSHRWQPVGYIAAHDKKQARDDLAKYGTNGPRVYKFRPL